MVRDIVAGGLLIAAILILLRIIWGTPLIARVRETFASGSMINSVTECPAGAQMYMSNGVSYCCSGTIDSAATRPEYSCRPSSSRDAVHTFCTLGPRKGEIPNCLELRSGLMEAEGAALCPHASPNYVKGPAAPNGRCCAGPGNAALTECVGTTQYCDVSTDSNEFKDPKSCQFLKAQEDAGACPANFGPFTAAGQGGMANLTLFGCTDNGQNCYATSTLKRLKELGYDVTGLTACK